MRVLLPRSAIGTRGRTPRSGSTSRCLPVRTGPIAGEGHTGNLATTCTEISGKSILREALVVRYRAVRKSSRCQLCKLVATLSAIPSTGRSPSPGGRRFEIGVLDYGGAFRFASRGTGLLSDSSFRLSSACHAFPLPFTRSGRSPYCSRLPQCRQSAENRPCWRTSLQTGAAGQVRTVLH